MRDRYGDKIKVWSEYYEHTGTVVCIDFYDGDLKIEMELTEDGANKFIKKIRNAIKENK